MAQREVIFNGLLNKPVYKAILLKEQFVTIYEYQQKKEAQPALRVWIGDALRSGLAPRGVSTKKRKTLYKKTDAEGGKI